jgi:hypothetical protein
MTSLKGMVTCISANAPSKLKFKSTLSILGTLLGRRMLMGGGLVWDVEGLVERVWFNLFFVLYTWNSCFFKFYLDSW